MKLRDTVPNDKNFANSIATVLSGTRKSGLTVEREFDTVPRVSLAGNKITYAKPTRRTDAEHLTVAAGAAILLLVVVNVQVTAAIF